MGHDKAPESCRQRTMKSAPQCGQVSAARLPSDTPHAVMHLQIIEAGGRFTWRYVANGSHCRAKCGSCLTASAWRAALTKRLDVKRPSIRARGHDRNTAPEASHTGRCEGATAEKAVP